MNGWVQRAQVGINIYLPQQFSGGACAPGALPLNPPLVPAGLGEVCLHIAAV